MRDQGILYVIATPIGNLADITFRALDTIKQVKILYAEDTRITKKLLDHYGIQANLESLHDFNEVQKIPKIIDKLLLGMKIGLVSDAGTPLISDPGYKIVSAAQKEGIQIRSVPGASAITTALSCAGIPTDRFVFEGFLPKKSAERKKRLMELQYESRSMVFYESPQRIQQCLHACIDVFGGDRQAVLMRELTKQFEQHHHGSLKQIYQALQDHPESIKGEFVLLLYGSTANVEAVSIERAKRLLEDLQQHISHKLAVEIASKHTGLRRNQIYSMGVKKRSKK